MADVFEIIWPNDFPDATPYKNRKLDRQKEMHCLMKSLIEWTEGVFILALPGNLNRFQSTEGI